MFFVKENIQLIIEYTTRPTPNVKKAEEMGDELKSKQLKCSALPQKKKREKKNLGCNPKSVVKSSF